MKLRAKTRTWARAPRIIATRIGPALVLAVCLAACSDSGKNPTGDGNPDTTVAFAAEVQPIFTASCATTDCHTGAQPAMGLRLSSADGYGNIVNRPSQEAPTYQLVRPSKPDSSYLYLKVEGASGIEGARMPFGGTLSATSIELIRHWIVQGAPAN
jgi:hypothetical protein